MNSLCCPWVYSWSASFSRLYNAYLVYCLQTSYPLLWWYYAYFSWKSLSSSSSSSFSPKSSALMSHLSLYLHRHPPVTLGDSQLLSCTNPSARALDLLTMCLGTTLHQNHPLSYGQPLPMKFCFLPLLYACCHHGGHNWSLSCLGHIPGLFNHCPCPVLTSYVQPASVIVTLNSV